MRSPSSVPPGSRMTTGSCELSHSPNISTCVVLPDPSVPSKVMKRPRPIRARSLGGFFGRKGDSQAPLRLLARAASGELVLGDQLVLKPSQIGVLGRDLHRAEGGLDGLDRGRSLGQRSSRPLITLVDAVDPRQRVT